MLSDSPMYVMGFNHPTTLSSCSHNWFLQRKKKAWCSLRTCGQGVDQPKVKRRGWKPGENPGQLGPGWKTWIWRVWRHQRGAGGKAGGGRGLRPSKTTLRYLPSYMTQVLMSTKIPRYTKLLRPSLTTLRYFFWLKISRTKAFSYTHWPAFSFGIRKGSEKIAKQ